MIISAIATLRSVRLKCITYGNCFQRAVAGLKPSFSVDFSVNEGYFVSNMVVVLAGSKAAIVKQPKIVKQLIKTIETKNLFETGCIEEIFNYYFKPGRLSHVV